MSIFNHVNDPVLTQLAGGSFAFPGCTPMSLVAQIDSFDTEGYRKIIPGNRYLFSDVGKIYTFFPFCDCGTDPIAVFQFY